MTVDELVGNLASMFPDGFTGEALESWARIYRTALESYEGAALRKAFDATLAEWRYSKPPKPADFAVAAAAWRRANQAPSVETRGAPPTSQDQVVEHVVRSIGARTIRQGEAEKIVETWIRKCGCDRVLDAAQAHWRRRPGRCIPWIEHRLYGPADPTAYSVSAIFAGAREAIFITQDFTQPGAEPAREIFETPADEKLEEASQ